jgi:hypothetical protein
MSRQVIVAFLAAPLVAAALFVTISSLDGGLNGGLGNLLVTLLAAYCYAAIGTIVVAIPAFLIFRKFNLVRWWTASIGGALLGFVSALVIGSPSAPILRGRLPLAGIGVAAGLVFWLIVNRRQPEERSQIEPRV